MGIAKKHGSPDWCKSWFIPKGEDVKEQGPLGSTQCSGSIENTMCFIFLPWVLGLVRLLAGAGALLRTPLFIYLFSYYSEMLL